MCGCCKRAKELVIELPGYGGVCAECKRLLTKPVAGIVPTAFENGITIRSKRCDSNRI